MGDEGIAGVLSLIGVKVNTGVSVIFPVKLSERCVASKGHIIVN